jgi:hypothetical protein
MSDEQTDNLNNPETSSVTSVSGGVNVDAGHDVNSARVEALKAYLKDLKEVLASL